MGLASLFCDRSILKKRMNSKNRYIHLIYYLVSKLLQCKRNAQELAGRLHDTSKLKDLI